MSLVPPHLEDRMIELLADRALGALSHEDAAELAALLRKYPELDTDVLDLAAAAVALAYEGAPFEPLPAHLAARAETAILQDGKRTVVDPRAGLQEQLYTVPISGPPRALRSDAPPPPDARSPAVASIAAKPTPIASAPRTKARRSPFAYAGWAAAAAFFLVSATLFRSAYPTAVPLANERARLMAEPETLSASFTALKDEAAQAAQGDLVWNSREQRGFMRFRGLAANPREGWVYQLWIFDATQDDRFPIDGGVFDIDPANGDVLVPIKAKIQVNKPTQFVVTIEKPGGVVVSKRERVAMLAKI